MPLARGLDEADAVEALAGPVAVGVAPHRVDHAGAARLGPEPLHSAWRWPCAEW
jgi:hypothetical protein